MLNDIGYSIKYQKYPMMLTGLDISILILLIMNALSSIKKICHPINIINVKLQVKNTDDFLFVFPIQWVEMRDTIITN